MEDRIVFALSFLFLKFFVVIFCSDQNENSNLYYRCTILNNSGNIIDELWNNPREKTLISSKVELTYFEFPFFGQKFSMFNVLPNLKKGHQRNKFEFIGVTFQESGHIYLYKVSKDTNTTLSDLFHVTIYESSHSVVLKWNAKNYWHQKQSFGLILEQNGKITMLFKKNPMYIEPVENQFLMVDQANTSPELKFKYFVKLDDVVIDRINSIDRINLGHNELSPMLWPNITKFAIHNLNNQTIRNDSNVKIEFNPLETCLDFGTCQDCLNSGMPIPCAWNQDQCGILKNNLLKYQCTKDNKLEGKFLKIYRFRNLYTYHSFFIFYFH